MENISFEIKVKGVYNFDEQCRIQSAIQNQLQELGYTCNHTNFKVLYEI